jgi:branched-chain amino acid transport system substrate-binding protein
MERGVLLALAIAAVVASGGAPALADDQPGITATEIKIGQTMPHSGPVPGTIGNGEAAFFKMINEHGGINGRKINFISLDDEYSPPKTVEQTRRLVEDDGVAFLFGSLGTAQNLAVEKYLNTKHVPQLFVVSGADKWADPQNFPWTIGWMPSFRIEAQIFARYIEKTKPGAKIGLLYQNDDFGRDYIRGLKEYFGDRYASMVVKEVSYEATDPTVDSQIVTLWGSGVDTLIVAATPKFASMAIRKVADVNWKPLFFLSGASTSVSNVIKPAGFDKAVGIISGGHAKDATDPAWKDDPGMNEWRDFMRQYMPDANPTDSNLVYAYNSALTLVQVLKQCGDDLSRENIMRQATNLHDLALPTLLPGITVNTSPTNYHPVAQLQLQRWNGETWERFGTIEKAGGAS